MANADYSIDRAEIETLIAWLNAMTGDIDDLNGGGSGSTSDLTLDTVAVKGGSTQFQPGVRVTAAAKKLGQQVLARLDKMAGNSDELAVKLQAALDKAERVENLNQLSAAEFGKYTPPAVTTTGSGNTPDS